MSKNTGVLITGTIRPNDSQDPIAVVYTNEAKGGHHVYQSLSERNSIIDSRRDFGMLVTVYNDATASNNKTYQLKYGYNSATASDNLNWVSFSSGGDSGSTNEWLNSVLSITGSIPSSVTNGDRYLIVGTMAGTSSAVSSLTWAGHNDNVTQYDSSTLLWNFTIPSEGMTVRVDNENGLFYRFSGTYSSGSWVKEYYNQVYFLTATSSNGYDFNAGAILAKYSKPSVFYTNFATSSSGTSASININSLGKVTIKKMVGNILYDIGSNDLLTSIEYQLIYDGTYFQVPLSSGVTTIGNAEDGDYSDGLYTDFTTSTPIGTAVDRFNEVLKALAPASAPGLTSINGTSSGYATGRLSFPSAQIPSIGYKTVYTASSPYGNVTVDGLWSIGATADGGIYRLGIYSAIIGNSYNVSLSGRLNYNISTSSTIPTAAYPQYAFSDGTTGMLYMLINGLTISSVSLTNSYSATDSTIGFSRPGLSVSAATSSKFPGGANFDLFYNRTANWYIPSTCLSGSFSMTSSIGLTANSFGLVRGYNNLIINHYKNSANTILSRIEFILDDSSTAISVANSSYPNFTSVTTGASNTKVLSGITYYNYLNVTYDAVISNAYYNVYSQDSGAVVFTENYSAGTGISLVSSIITSSSQSLPTVVNIIASPGVYGTLASLTYPTQTYTVGSSKRRILDPVSVYVSNIKHPLNGITFSSGYTNLLATLNYVLLDTYAASSTLGAITQYEYFDDEQYRLKTGLSYDTIASVTTNVWTAITQLSAAETGLQIYNGRLYYPTIDFSALGSVTTNYCYGNVLCNYSALTSNRTYYRYFYLNPSTRTSKAFSMVLSGSASLIPYATAFSTTAQIKIAIKLPGASTFTTGWADTLTAYTNDAALLAAEGGGCYSGTVPSSITLTSSPTTISLSTGGLGTQLTAGSNGYVLLRVTSNTGWVGYLDSVSFVYN